MTIEPITRRERPLTLIRLTYVSNCAIPATDQVDSINALLWHARRSNAIDGITGALLFTGPHFAQTLEGSAAAIDALMMRIARDPRHFGLIVVDRQEVGTRQFGRWAMGYRGSSVFIARMVARARRGDPYDVKRLLALVRAFGQPGSWQA